jgi:hypothetical protein
MPATTRCRLQPDAGIADAGYNPMPATAPQKCRKPIALLNGRLQNPGGKNRKSKKRKLHRGEREAFGPALRIRLERMSAPAAEDEALRLSFWPRNPMGAQQLQKCNKMT